MTTRAETAAATRRALLAAARSLLADGGPSAVTLRAVGTLAGVSRGAPYGHFSAKEDLLAALAAEQWRETAAQLAALRMAPLSPRDRLEGALRSWLGFARGNPHLYGLMFTAPPHDPDDLLAAADAAQDEFLQLVADAVRAPDVRRVAALLLAAAHGMAGLEQAGQLEGAKWGASGDDLIRQLVERWA